MVESDKETVVSQSVRGDDRNFDSMLDRMKSWDHFRIGSRSSKAISDAKETTKCWISSAALGILENYGPPLAPPPSSVDSILSPTEGNAVASAASTSNYATFYKSIFRGNVSDFSKCLTTGSDAKSPIAAGPTNDSSTSSSRFYQAILMGDNNPLDFSKYLNTEMVQSSAWSLRSRFEQLASEYLTAIAVGAAMGAAVATGVSVGLLAMSGLLRMTNDYVPVLYRFLFPNGRSNHDAFRATQHTRKNKNESSISRGQSTEESKMADSDISIIHSGLDDRGILVVLKGTVKSKFSTSSLDQCRSCLDSVSVLLSKQGMVWQDVKRLTAFLVTDQCDGHTFRQALGEYPFQSSSSILSLIFVQRLEQPQAMVEIEVLASRDT